MLNPFRMDAEKWSSVIAGCLAYVLAGLVLYWLLFYFLPDGVSR